MPQTRVDGREFFEDGIGLVGTGIGSDIEFNLGLGVGGAKDRNDFWADMLFFVAGRH